MKHIFFFHYHSLYAEKIAILMLDATTITFTGRKNGFTRVAKLQQMGSKYHICTILRKSKD